MGDWERPEFSAADGRERAHLLLPTVKGGIAAFGIASRKSKVKVGSPFDFPIKKSGLDTGSFPRLSCSERLGYGPCMAKYSVYMGRQWVCR